MISIIVPVYNTAALLPRCVDSLLAQSYDNIEIILINDGSTDGSDNICDTYANKYINVTVIHKPNGGVSSARNAGLGVSRGCYIGFVDSDDWIKSEMYAALYTALIKHDAQIAACGYTIHRYDGVIFNEKVDPATPERLELEQALESLIHPRGIQGFLCNKLFDRELLKLIGGGNLLLLDEQIHICEDLLYVSSCVVTAGFVAYDNRPFYVYCVRDNSNPENYNRQRRISEFIALDRLVESWSSISERLGAHMKRKYTTDAYNIIRAVAAARDNEYIPTARMHLRRYLISFLRSGTINPSRKARVIIAILFPNLENIIKKVVRG